MCLFLASSCARPAAALRDLALEISRPRFDFLPAPVVGKLGEGGRERHDEAADADHAVPEDVQVGGNLAQAGARRFAPERPHLGDLYAQSGQT